MQLHHPTTPHIQKISQNKKYLLSNIEYISSCPYSLEDYGPLVFSRNYLFMS